jgi:hypothetical protein
LEKISLFQNFVCGTDLIVLCAFELYCHCHYRDRQPQHQCWDDFTEEKLFWKKKWMEMIRVMLYSVFCLLMHCW